MRASTLFQERVGKIDVTDKTNVNENNHILILIIL